MQHKARATAEQTVALAETYADLVERGDVDNRERYADRASQLVQIVLGQTRVAVLRNRAVDAAQRVFIALGLDGAVL